MKDNRYIGIEGPIGVGKSSLAKKLANTFSSITLLEQPSENVFLERFYHSPDRYALHAQLSFLFQRAEQLSKLKKHNSFNEGCIADYILEKDLLFAEITLNADELALYKKVYANLAFDVPTPDLLIYLQAPTDVLVKRIKKRGIRYELNIDKIYLEKLNNSYTTFFHKYSRTALLIINAAEINPVDDESHYRALVNQILRIKAGKHYFNPLLEAL